MSQETLKFVSQDKLNERLKEVSANRDRYQNVGFNDLVFDNAQFSITLNRDGGGTAFERMAEPEVDKAMDAALIHAKKKSVQLVLRRRPRPLGVGCGYHPNPKIG